MTALRTFASLLLARWIAAFVLAAIHLVPMAAVAHPLHSEAIERPCELHRNGDNKLSSINGRCSFFLATGYLVFRLDVGSGDKSTSAQTLSGVINLGKSTGSLFTAKERLANGQVTLAEQSPQVVHMKPGALASWANGYVLTVGGHPAKAADTTANILQRSTESVFEVFANYLELGFLHIIPRGFDHILFVIGLFLLSPRLKALLWQVSAFTVAHTLTLALGATGVVRLPANIVEPLIALSILWVAVENLLTDKLHRWRIVVVFCFGLLHGLGFAGVLIEIGLSGAHFYAALLAFNIGVELGQLTVIALCFLAFGWAMQRPGYHRRVVAPASCAIAIIAAYWVIHRTGVV